MTATNFNTRNDTYRKLVGNGLTYRIPRFQRDYSWTEEEWEDLWTDILGTVADGAEPAHYMGYLVLQSEDEKTFDVIDGQQRLTTLSLIVLAVLKNLQRLVDEGKNPEQSRQRLEQIRGTYIGYLDPVTLVPRTKLTLNRNNDHYYQTYIVPLQRLPLRGFRASEHALRKAFEWFERRVREFADKAGGDEGVALAQLVDRMSDRLFFTVITVTDELNAFRVFETLNARGVRLSTTDLLKNYLFSVLHRAREHEHELTKLEERWERMVGRLGGESFPDFVRAHWNSRREFVRHTELFKRMRAHVRTREDVFRLLREMEEDLDTYVDLVSPETPGNVAPIREAAVELRMFGVRQPLPLLLAARRRLPERDFVTLLRHCVVISFRYNVIGTLPPSEQETVYNESAVRLSDEPEPKLADVVASLSSIYPSDEVFRAAFAGKAIRTTQGRNRRIVRYVLCRLEWKLSGVPLDHDSDVLTLEHVLPQSPEQGWDAFPETETEEFVYRLGNMTLLRRGENRELGNAAYAAKRAVYASSGYEITRKLADENADWTPERLDARQQWMARQATSLWRIDALS